MYDCSTGSTPFLFQILSSLPEVAQHALDRKQIGPFALLQRNVLANTGYNTK